MLKIALSPFFSPIVVHVPAVPWLCMRGVANRATKNSNLVLRDFFARPMRKSHRCQCLQTCVLTKLYTPGSTSVAIWRTSRGEALYFLPSDSSVCVTQQQAGIVCAQESSPCFSPQRSVHAAFSSAFEFCAPRCCCLADMTIFH